MAGTRIKTFFSFILWVFMVFFTPIKSTFAVTMIEFSDNKLTVMAENASMVHVLEEVAKKANIAIFVSEEFNPGPVTIQITEVPLEQAFKKLLKEHNFVTVYNKAGGDFTVTALKVYPKGKSTGKMDALITETVPAENISTDAAVSVQDPPVSATVPGEIIPGAYVQFASKKDKSMIQMAHGFEQTEETAVKEINELKQKVSQTQDEVEKDTLNLELMNRVVAFQDMQREHGDAMESLYRASLFDQETKKADE